jgi:acyl-CoA thioester hydrolase
VGQSENIVAGCWLLVKDEIRKGRKMGRSVFSSYQDYEKITVRVRYADTDRMGVVYHANYFVYFESGRAELIRRLWKSYREIEEAGLILPITEAGCTYYRGAQYDDLLTVCTRMVIFSGARLRFNYSIYKTPENSPLAEGFTVHCFTDMAGKPRRMPVELVTILESL